MKMLIESVFDVACLPRYNMKFLNVPVIILFLLIHQFLVYAQENSPATILKSKFSTNPDGSYEFEFKNSDGTSRREKGVFQEDENHEPRLIVVGTYTYFDPAGAVHTIYYKADKKGYRIIHDIPVTRISADVLGSLLGGGI